MFSEDASNVVVAAATRLFHFTLFLIAHFSANGK